MMSEAARKRLEVRCSANQRELIDRAVHLAGRSLTDFVLDAVQEAAMNTIKDHETMELTVRDSRMLAEALLNPGQPNAKLREAAERYKAATEPKPKQREAVRGRYRAATA